MLTIHDSQPAEAGDPIATEWGKLPQSLVNRAIG